MWILNKIVSGKLVCVCNTLILWFLSARPEFFASLQFPFNTHTLLSICSGYNCFTLSCPRSKFVTDIIISFEVEGELRDNCVTLHPPSPPEGSLHSDGERWKLLIFPLLLLLLLLLFNCKGQIWNRTRPRALVQNQQTRELISARKTSDIDTTTQTCRVA